MEAEKPAIPTSIEEPLQQKAVTQVEGEVFADGKLASGLDMGVDSEGGCRDWVTREPDGMKLAYPGKSCGAWGAVFITVGPPARANRRNRDFFQYRTLEVEMRGDKGGELVDVGIKDWKQADDGLERKATVTASKEWKTHKIRLADLPPLNDPDRRAADLAHLYVVCEFVFGEDPQTVHVRRVRYSR